MGEQGNPIDTLNTMLHILSSEIDTDSPSREDILRYLYDRLGLELQFKELVKEGRA